MSKRAVKQFPLECMDAVELDVTGSAPQSFRNSAMGDADGFWVFSPERISRVSMHFNHHLTA